jgi:predicted Rossmann-fold nucleotide-binding protein
MPRLRDVGEELTRMGCDIITGGGPGLMAAANEGTKRADPTARTSSVGIRVQLPFEQQVNPLSPRLMSTGLFLRAFTSLC